MSKKLESWARADLVTEIERLRAENATLRERMEATLTEEIGRLRVENTALQDRLAEALIDAFGTSAHLPTPVVATALANTQTSVSTSTPAPPSPGLFDDLFKLDPNKPAPPAKPKREPVFVQDYGKGYVEFCAEAVHETDMALLVKVGGDKVWFPKSALHQDSQVRATGDVGTIIVLERLADEKGIA